jgi:hypothetical protein
MKYLAIPLLVLGAMMAAAADPAPNLAFGQVVDQLDSRKHTKLNVQEYWRSVKGREVSWSGEVVDVRGGKSRAKIYLANGSRPLYKGYNIVVTTHDLERAAALKKGQTARVRGTLDGYHAKGSGAVINLDNGIILR